MRGKPGDDNSRRAKAGPVLLSSGAPSLFSRYPFVRERQCATKVLPGHSAGAGVGVNSGRSYSPGRGAESLDRSRRRVLGVPDELRHQNHLSPSPIPTGAAGSRTPTPSKGFHE